MATEVLMPLMGEGITEATLVKWLKKPGDSVKREEPLLEVATDKVDTEIPSPADGFLVETFANEGTTVAINSVIAHIAASLDQAAAKPGATAKPTKLSSETPSQATTRPSVGSAGSVDVEPTAQQLTGSGGLVRSSPLVRKIARAEGIDLKQVRGSGLAGRITRKDLESFLAGASRPVNPQPATPPGELLARLSTSVTGGIETLEGVPVRREKMSKIRRLTAEHMVQSVRTSPHVTTVFEIDLHRVVKIRNAEKARFEKQHGFKLTYTPFLIHAACEAIKRHPIVNCSVDGDDILFKNDINIGCAVAIETGLIVPVIKQAGELNLLGITKRLNDIVMRARSKKLLPDELKGGTFSITNPGMYGSIISAPLINQPQVAILSIGAIIERPVVIDGMIGIRPLCQIGLTFDHRVIDGEGGAKFLATLKDILENYKESAL